MIDSLNEQQTEKYLLSKPETSLYYPFCDDVKVFRVKNKMFATLIAHGSTAKSAKTNDEAKTHFWVPHEQGDLEQRNFRWFNPTTRNRVNDGYFVYVGGE